MDVEDISWTDEDVDAYFQELAQQAIQDYHLLNGHNGTSLTFELQRHKLEMEQILQSQV